MSYSHQACDVYLRSLSSRKLFSLCTSYYIEYIDVYSTHHPLLPGVLNVDSLWVSLNLVLFSAFWFPFFWASVGPYHLNLIPEIISCCPWSPCSTGHVMDSLCPFSWHPHSIFALAGTGFLRNYHVQTWPVSLLLEHLLPFSWIAFVYTIFFGGAMSPCSSLHPSTWHRTTHYYCSEKIHLY